MNYRIEYLGFGFTAWQGYTIKNVEEYDDKSKMPTFNTDDAPLTEGLKLLEKGGKIKIVDLDNEADEPTEDEPVDEVDEQVKEPTEDEPVDEPTGDEPVDEVESTVEVQTNTVEFDGQEVELDEKALDDAFTSTDLDDLCKEKDIAGYSKLNKGEKIELIIKELA